jgi:hypothetical protein
LPSQETIERLTIETTSVVGRHWPSFHITRKPCIYIIGSLRNTNVTTVGNLVRAAGFEAFDDWHGTGPEADDHWFKYEKLRGRSFIEALSGRAAQNTFALDRDNILRSDAVIMVTPAGKSGHLEFGFARGNGKPGVILMDGEPERYDVMYNFASKITFDVQEAIDFIAVEIR